MKLSTRTRYGARLLLDLARHRGQGPIQVGKIAERQGVSVKYLEQIVRPLKRAGLVSSTRGPKGGHVLAKDPGVISLGDIVRLMETGDELTECLKHPDKCIRSSDCSVRLAWQDATTALYEKLNAITFTNLLNSENRMRGEGVSHSHGSK